MCAWRWTLSRHVHLHGEWWVYFMCPLCTYHLVQPGDSAPLSTSSIYRDIPVGSVSVARATALEEDAIWNVPGLAGTHPDRVRKNTQQSHWECERRCEAQTDQVWLFQSKLISTCPSDSNWLADEFPRSHDFLSWSKAWKCCQCVNSIHVQTRIITCSVTHVSITLKHSKYC